MTESVVKIANAATVTRDGTGSAKKRRNGKRIYHTDGNDTVTISLEARQRSLVHTDTYATTPENGNSNERYCDDE